MDIHFYTTLFTWLNIALIIVICVLVAKLFRALNKYLKQNSQPSRNRNICIGDVIKEYRVKNNMTQEFVAHKLGISRQAVSKWENGTSFPSTSNLLSLAKLYNIPAEELIPQTNTK